MPTSNTEGIVLKRRNFGEADRIMTVLTPYKGKITVLAKGTRRITSRRGGNIEVLNKVRLQIYVGRGMSILTEAQSIEDFPKIKSDIILTSYASHLIELIDRLIPEDQVNPAVYNLLGSTLSLLENNPRQLFIRAFEIKLLSLLGFWSDTQIETNEGVKKKLQELEDSSWGEINKMEINRDQALELERILRYYLEKVLEGPLKSMEVIKKLQK